MKKDIASKVEEIKGKKTIDPKSLGIPAYTPKKAEKTEKKPKAETVDGPVRGDYGTDLNYYINEFDKAWNLAEENIQKAADAYWNAVCLVGEKEAEKKFSTRYPSLKHSDWTLLRDIGAQTVDARVFMLPWYMQGVRYMKLPDQWALFNTRCVSVYKFASEKPVTIDIGRVNQSDWRVAFDREKNRLRTSDEQIKYIRSKKKELKERINWHIGTKGLVVTNSCTLSRKQLEDILAQM